jgi:hypothetical protein
MGADAQKETKDERKGFPGKEFSASAHAKSAHLRSCNELIRIARQATYLLDVALTLEVALRPIDFVVLMNLGQLDMINDGQFPVAF